MQVWMSVSPWWSAHLWWNHWVGVIKNAYSRPHSTSTAVWQSLLPSNSTFRLHIECFSGVLFHCTPSPWASSSISWLQLQSCANILRFVYIPAMWVPPAFNQLSAPLHLAVPQAPPTQCCQSWTQHLSYPNLSPGLPSESGSPFLPDPSFLLPFPPSPLLLPVTKSPNSPFLCHLYCSHASIWFSQQPIPSLMVHLPAWLLDLSSRLQCKSTCISSRSLRPRSRAVSLFFDVQYQRHRVTGTSYL